MEYSITEDELREIIEMLGNGWYCETVEADETLYVRFQTARKPKTMSLYAVKQRRKS